MMNNIPTQKKTIILLLLNVLFSAILLAQGDTIAPLLKKARDHLNLFHYDQARAILQKAIQLDPENWEAYYLIGKSFLKQKKEFEAEKFLRKANELNPDDLDCQKALGAVYIFLAKQSQKEGKSAEMVDYLHKACKAYPCGTKIWLTLFENWWRKEEYSKIEAEGDFLVRSNKRTLEQGDDVNLQKALVIVAKCYFRKNDFPNAEKYIKTASMIRQTNEELYALQREIKAKSEENARNLIAEAQKELDAGNYDKAMEIITQAEKTSNKSEIQEMVDKIQKETSVHKFLLAANALRQQNKHEEALEKLEEAAMQFPEDERIANLMAVVSKTVEKIHNEEAARNAKLIEEKKKRLERAQKLRFFVKEAKGYEDEKKYDIAIISYEKALKIAPENDSLKKKIESLKTLSAKQKERQNAYAMAKAELENLISQNDYEAAYEKGKEILAEYKENKIEISLIMAELCLKLKKFDEAKEFAVVFEDSPENLTLYNYVRGMAAYNLGEYDAALEYLNKVSEKNASFRNDVGSTRWRIYLYKFQIGIYIILLILIFPLFRFLKATLVNFKKNRILKKLEKIRESGEYEANLAFLEERFTKEDCPNPRQVAVMLAEGLLRTGNPQRAYELVSNVLKREAKNPHAKRLAGEACLQLEDSSPMGLEHIQNLYKMDESRKDVVEYLARTYMKMQADHKLDQDFILKFISLNPGDTEAVIFLADTYIRRQTYTQQTLKIFERAIKIAPDVPDYYEALIQNHRKLENHEEARKIAEMARSRFPQEPAFLDGPPTSGKIGAAKIGLKNSGAVGFPDYENIGEPQQPSVTPGGFPDYENIGADETPLPPLKTATPSAQPSPSVVSGAAKVCPHCAAANSVKDYYCNTCGKPL